MTPAGGHGTQQSILLLWLNVEQTQALAGHLPSLQWC